MSNDLTVLTFSLYTLLYRCSLTSITTTILTTYGFKIFMDSSDSKNKIYFRKCLNKIQSVQVHFSVEFTDIDISQMTNVTSQNQIKVCLCLCFRFSLLAPQSKEDRIKVWLQKVRVPEFRLSSSVSPKRLNFCL